MDTPISEEVITQKRRKNTLLIIIGIAGFVVAIFVVRGFFKSSISRSKFTTAVVETGNIENTITAAGEVLPEFEEVLTSPINSSIKSAPLDAGTQVKAEQSILMLDQSASENESIRCFALQTNESIQVFPLNLFMTA